MRPSFCLTDYEWWFTSDITLTLSTRMTLHLNKCKCKVVSSHYGFASKARYSSFPDFDQDIIFQVAPLSNSICLVPAKMQQQQVIHRFLPFFPADLQQCDLLSANWAFVYFDKIHEAVRKVILSKIIFKHLCCWVFFCKSVVQIMQGTFRKRCWPLPTRIQ